MQYILFDLDGTLIDHFTTIHKSVAHAQRELGLPESDYATVRATVGGSIAITLRQLCGEDKVAEAEPLYRAHFDQIIYDDVFALPGAEWLLKTLKARGDKLAVFTNKYTHHSRSVLAHLGLDRWLDCVIGTSDEDASFRKPDPRFTVHALEQMDCSSEEALIIGDSPYDIAAAEAGCVPCHTVATGSHSATQLAEHIVAEHVHDDLYQLGEKVFGLEPELYAVN